MENKLINNKRYNRKLKWDYLHRELHISLSNIRYIIRKDGGIISSEESAIVMNPNSISRDTTIPSNYNAQTIGPTITVNDGVSVTISSNGEWTITK